MEGSWVIWLLAGLLTIGSGAFLSALEAVLWQMPRAIRPRALPGDLSNLRDTLLAIFVTVGGVLRVLGWWMLWLAARGMANWAQLPAWACIAALVGAAVLMEVIPPVIAARRPRVWEPLLWRVGGVLLRLFGGPFDRMQPVFGALATRLFPWSARARPPLDTAEAETLVWIREEQGEFTTSEAEVLCEVLQLSRQTVRQYMTPRMDVIFAEDVMSNDQVRELLLKRQLLRVPVIGETPDEVVGLLDARTFGRLPEGMHFTEALLPPSFVPETMEASELLGSFLRHRQPLAVVLDEFGGVEGVVTLDDFIEEILRAAAPRVEADLYIEQTGEGRLMASGSARLEDLSEYLGFDARMEGVETIGGYIINSLGKLPYQGASVRLGSWKVTVRSMMQRRVREVMLRQIRKPSEKGVRR